jgi:hypothetical protein
MGSEDLASHYQAIGDLRRAAQALHRMRDYCTSPKHVADMSLKIISVAIEQGSWMLVLSHVHRIRALALKPDELAKLAPRLNAAAGLAEMCSGRYAEAAQHFLRVDTTLLGSGGGSGSGSGAGSSSGGSVSGSLMLRGIGGAAGGGSVAATSGGNGGSSGGGGGGSGSNSSSSSSSASSSAAAFRAVALTANDVAVYGGLCALATLDGAALQARVLDNAAFRHHLELEPHVRRAIAFFCAAKFPQSLGVLRAHRADFLLDVYLRAHVGPLFALIRAKSLVAWCVPYQAVSLASMARAFDAGSGGGSSGGSDVVAAAAAGVEREVFALTKTGALNARIDAANKVR